MMRDISIILVQNRPFHYGELFCIGIPIFMFKWLLIIIFPSLLFTSLQAAPNEYFVLWARPVGMFSVFHEVLCLTRQYEQKNIAGFNISFGKTGLYYDTAYGPNWWKYYFEPLKVGNSKGKNIVTVHGDHPLTTPFSIENIVPRKELHALIKKYIRIRPNILNAINNFQQTHFKNSYIIGVHYRGTDKQIEAPRVPYKKVELLIKEMLRRNVGKKCKIFIATDEKAFIDFAIKTFGKNRVLYNKFAQRSTDGKCLHGGEKRYEQGKHALMDCVLLSRANVLIRTSSNLSLVSTYFNPHLPVIELSKRHGQ